MRLAIISDIHSNWEALQAIYRKLHQKGYDQLICLGDVVGYGPDPVRCIDFLIEHDIICLKGNHDAFTADTAQKLDWSLQENAKLMVQWTQSILSTTHLKWLNNLPLHLVIEGINMVHASLECVSGEYWPYVLDQKTAQFHFYLQDTRLAFCGHVHIPLLFTASGGTIKMEMLRRRNLPEKISTKFLVSPGSVGQPRDMDWRAAAVILDTEDSKLIPLRSSYNVAKLRDKFKRTGMPQVNPERIFRG